MSDKVRALVVLHGDYANVSELPLWAKDADRIIAADGGAEHALAAGLSPDVVTGDFDGISESVKQKLPPLTVRPNANQSTTDCQKALAVATDEFHATQIVIYAAEGTRIDHMLSTLGAASQAPALTKVIFSSSIAYFVKSNTKFSTPVEPGAVVSLIPLIPTMVTATSGLRWPADGLSMSLGTRDGVSNEATQSEISIAVESGCLAVFIGRHEGDIHW